MEAVARALMPHVAVRQAAQLRIDDQRQLAEGQFVSVAPRAEQLDGVVISRSVEFSDGMMVRRSSIRLLRSARGPRRK